MTSAKVSGRLFSSPTAPCLVLTTLLRLLAMVARLLAMVAMVEDAKDTGWAVQQYNLCLYDLL